MKMFEIRRHAALFDPEGNVENVSSVKNDTEQVEVEIQSMRKELQQLQEGIKGDTRKNNDTVSSKTENKDISVEDRTDEQLSKLLSQLAKNKRLNYSWTNEQWKCSIAEKRLAVASVKVFQQLLDINKVQDMVAKCMHQEGDLDDATAEQRKSDLGINSIVADIKSFNKAYKEYQNSQSEYVHLRGLMGFLLEKGVNTKEEMFNSLEEQSVSITSKEISDKAKTMYKTIMSKSSADDEWRTQWIDARTNNFIESKPKDWKKRARFEIVVDRLREAHMAQTDKMLSLLGDYNLDGRVNAGDVGGKTGTQLGDVFRRTVASTKLEHPDFDDNQAVKNLVAYANKRGLNIEGVDSVENLYKWMTDYVDIDNGGYQNTQKLQNFIKNLPVELGDVLKKGEKAGDESLKHIVAALNIAENEQEVAKQAATDKTKELVDKYDSLLKERIKDATQRANITQQLLSQLPGVLMEQATNMQKGLSAGVAIPLDELIRGLSVGLSVGIDENGKPHCGIYGAWGHDFLLGKGIDINTGASAGINSFLIPCESLFVELGIDVSEAARNESLDTMGVNRISVGANCTMCGPLFSRGLSAGFENNKQAGIEKQAKNINAQLFDKGLSFVDALKGKESKEDKESALKEQLKTMFPKSSNEELDKAVINILQVVVVDHLVIDEKTTDRDKQIYSHIIADVFTEMWRNDAIAHISDNKWKLSGGKVGIQFLAGYYPVGTLVLKFTKYYNARTVETENSRKARMDAAVNGTGNRNVELGESKEIGQDKVSQLNDVLKQYGAKAELKYIPGVDGKPGRIVVPANIEGLGINVRISSALEGFIQEAEGGFSFPANTTYRLFQEGGGDQKSITLNIGANHNATDDIRISDVESIKTLIGNEELMGGKRHIYREGVEFKAVEKGLEFTAGFDNLFTPEIIAELERIDSKDWKKFSAFMRTKKDIKLDFEATKNALLNCLPKQCDAIRTKLKDDNVSNEDKQLIIDKIMAISATANVHDGRGFDANIKERGSYYRTSDKMKGANGEFIFNKIQDYRTDLISEIKKEGKYTSEYKSNLLGATAFYHKNNNEKGLAVTGLGSTSVLGGKTKEISWEDKTTVENWFLGYNNGEYVPGVLDDKSLTEWNNLNRAISNYIKEQLGSDFSGNNTSGLSKLSKEGLKDLLRGKDVELDISNKKCKVKLDVKYMFYLMGECANESVGMQLGKLSVMNQEEVQDYAEGALFLNDEDGSSSIEISRKDRAVGESFGGGEKGESKEDSPRTRPEVDENDIPGVDPSSNPNAHNENPGGTDGHHQGEIPGTNGSTPPTGGEGQSDNGTEEGRS